MKTLHGMSRRTHRLRRFIRRRKDAVVYHLARFALWIYPPKTGDRHRDILELAHRFSQILEDRIRQNPGEWAWWHRRWRRDPIPGIDLDGS